MKKLRCAVIGVGYLGNFHTEKYAALDYIDLIGVCDTDPQRCTEVSNKYNVHGVIDYRELIDEVDAVSIVVPTSMHHKVAMEFLNNNVHVLLEKPIATTVQQAQELIDAAKKNNCVFQIGHLERFNTVLQSLDKVLDGPKFIESHRLLPSSPVTTGVLSF